MLCRLWQLLLTSEAGRAEDEPRQADRAGRPDVSRRSRGWGTGRGDAAAPPLAALRRAHCTHTFADGTHVHTGTRTHARTRLLSLDTEPPAVPPTTSCVSRRSSDLRRTPPPRRRAGAAGASPPTDLEAIVGGAEVAARLRVGSQQLRASLRLSLDDAADLKLAAQVLRDSAPLLARVGRQAAAGGASADERLRRLVPPTPAPR